MRRMFHHRRLQTLVIALLLATLPCVGRASFVREAQSACAMEMQMEGKGKGKGSHARVAMSDHCKAMDRAAKVCCQRGGQCSMCDDLSISLAASVIVLLKHELAASVYPASTDFLLNTTVASLWRPPRTL